MIINGVSYGDEQDGGITGNVEIGDCSHAYQTASELFDLMSKDHSFDADDEGSLTPRDLVILYKNIDTGNKLISDANELKLQKPNQYVETIVYKDDAESDDSNLSDTLSAEDLHNVFTVNKETIDFLSDRPSFSNRLCQKFGDIEIQSSNLNTEYNKHFLFQDTYIKSQLNAFNFDSGICEGSLLPTSLLDYICCKRLEDNYNFYMDNVIKYVKHTIEQLRRISNGEYLTDRVKEKWREVGNNERALNKSTKILTTSTSIPLHVERKTNRCISTWDDLVHSEVDVRSLSKILEKKIIIEVPKLICSSLKLFSRHCADNLIISCKNEKRPVMEENKEDENVSRVDLVFTLQKSQSGHMISNINSIMILQTPSNLVEALPITFEENNDNEITEDTLKITEICQEEYDRDTGNAIEELVESKDTYFGDHKAEYDFDVCTNDYPCSENEDNISKTQSFSESNDSGDVLKNILKTKPIFHEEPNFNIISPDELSITMQRLNKQMSLLEESGEEISMETNPTNKKNSPTRVRIKSPYENQSYILEEKKRKRLLEIRDKREKKKLALGENCKISKHKYSKGGVMPQSSKSVTKLPITNKSFYNSIYGQATTLETNKHTRGKERAMVKKDTISEVRLDQFSAESELPLLSSDRNSKKYINRSYYLDDAETEVMHMEMKKKVDCEMKACSASTSAVSSDFRENLKLLSQLISPSSSDLNKDDVKTDDTSTLSELFDGQRDLQTVENLKTPKSEKNKPSANSPDNALSEKSYKSDSKKITSSVECRKSIDKIYDLMKKLGKDVNEIKVPLQNKAISPIALIQHRGSSTIQGSDSGTSLKHHLTSSDPSCFSFEKDGELKSKIPSLQKPETPVVPKVIISTKAQPLKMDADKSKKNKKVLFNTSKAGDNPLKAISQLLHQFDNVQKTRQKSTEPKVVKRAEVPSPDVKNIFRRPTVVRRSRLDQHLKDAEYLDKNITMMLPRKPKHVVDISKVQHQPPLLEKSLANKKKIVDIIEEVKEARGEAVRGPSKFQSRLNSLAQPKKSYVQARSEECQIKYGKNVMSDRLQRLATVQSSVFERNVGSANSRNRLKKNGTTATSPASIKPRPTHPIAMEVRRSISTSPKRKPLTPCNVNNMPQTAETMKKIFAVETYVKGHYGSSPLGTALSEGMHPGHMSRVPLLPNDIDLSSITSTNTVEESNEIGNTLHCIVNKMLNKKSSPLAILTERVETSTKSKETDEFSLQNSLSKIDEFISENSDYYTIDILEDKNIVTAVGEDHKKLKGTNKELSKGSIPEVNNVMMELTKLDNSLCRQTYVGSFQKQLRIKNFTLSPKASNNLSFLMESGDTGSVVLKSSLSQNLKSSYDELGDLKALPVLSKSDLDWRFIKFPMQIATIGYVFPQYTLVNTDTNIKINTLRDNCTQNVKSVSTQEVESVPQNDQFFEFLKNNKPQVNSEQAVQVDHKEISTIVNIDPKINVTNEIKITESNDLTKLDFETKVEGVKNVDEGSIDYTTSLDMLVGLLNEIKKITTCQTHITNESNNEQQRKELETILNNATTTENYSTKKHPPEIDSVKSLNKLRQLKSSPSIYTFYLSRDEEYQSGVINHVDKIRHRNIYVDKEVEADFRDHITMNQFTEVPSIFPIKINHSTNVTNSLIGVLSEPSSQCLFWSNFEQKPMCSDNSPEEKITELPQAITQEEYPKNSTVYFENKVKFIEKINLDNIRIPIKQISNSTLKISNDIDTKTKIFPKNIKSDNNDDLDPTLKMKRDVLVTVYSILVFTVFAALSFPEIYAFRI